MLSGSPAVCHACSFQAEASHGSLSRKLQFPRIALPSPAADECDDLQFVAGHEEAPGVLRAGHDLQVPLDRQELGIELQLPQELRERRARGEFARCR